MKYSDKIFLNASEMIAQLVAWRQNERKIVFTNGCFDLIHIGHVTYLEDAKKLGDKLVVAINSDSSVSRLKGTSRPIKDEVNRMAIIASLQCVDMVVLFSEDTPLEVIHQICPDILVKGGDWSIDQIVGSKEVIAAGGEVKSLAFLEGYSSTRLIEKIQNG